MNLYLLDTNTCVQYLRNRDLLVGQRIRARHPQGPRPPVFLAFSLAGTGEPVRTSWQWDFMPTVLPTGPYRFYFYSHESHEPPHVHVDRDDLSAKFWLQPVGLARNLGFSPNELRRIQKLIAQHQPALLEAWHGHLGPGG